MSWREVGEGRQFRRPEMHAYRLALQVTPPWEPRAVLAGPFDPKVARGAWYFGRRARQARHGKGQNARLATHALSLINSVPVPLRHLRGILQTVRLTALGSTASPEGQQAWQQAFAANAQGWHTADLLCSPALPLAAKLAVQAVQRIQALRTRAYSNGGWWPAPSSITLAYRVDAAGRASLQASMLFAPHYMANGRTTLSLPPWV